MSAESTWCLASRVQVEAGPDGNGGVLLDTATATVCAVNATAMTLLVALGRGADIGQLATALTREYDVPARRAREDARALLRQLRTMGLVDAAG
ncbi:MAG: PqqD family protein [Alphaproteobacteria bacterium]|nr:PqqD family protein [Alphaproteobacteria bacterium]